MFEIFGKFSFVIIASYVSAIFLISVLIVHTLVSKVKTDKQLKKREHQNGAK